ncbi:putative calcium-binding protein [Neolecta irregularis DAH-3]|uniref:Putative calcium-binding protein n=1 Tax=Neolecta irregularis (strain DAH-3) TaxID=1198029 RepID=A0A1U7LQ75_NEOID|nr:putative calcium-binding protein [Neolecta irregularis DAH-3]|eukprot:OLL24826.1 putative calcium-binding protein [Neolecta irregularis DAH-3]
MSIRALSSHSDSSAPPPSLSAEERRAFGTLFRAADVDNLGVVTGDVAVRFFERSGLPPAILGEIWSIADASNQGFLAPHQFSVSMRLIGHCQAGRRPSIDLAKLPGAIPRFDGIDLGISTPASTTQTSKSPQPPPPNRIPVLGIAERTRYLNMFANSDPTNGHLDGDKARTFFLRTRLPNDVLAQIWSLVDAKKCGYLDSTEFVIAMHLIQCLMNGSLKTPPTILPPGIYDAAAGKSSERKGSMGSRRQSGGPTMPSIPKQLTGQFTGRQSPMSRQVTAQLSQHQTGENLDWDVIPADKKHYDSLFSTVDQAGKGYITGGEAVSFFMSSKLPDDILAHIWDLADLSKEGQLNRDEFAVAMHLIKTKISGKELPDTLPYSLIPPLQRRQVMSQGGPQTKFGEPSLEQVVGISSLASDLFGLDSPFGTSQEAVAPQSTGQGPFMTPTQDMSGGSPNENMSSKPSPFLKSFVPTSSFGQSLTTPQKVVPQSTGPFNSDLLGDDYVDLAKKPQDSVDFANISNQISSLSSATTELRSRRSDAERELSNITLQKHDFGVRLAQIRALYEGEVKIVRQVEDQLSVALGEIKHLRQEFATAESSYDSLQAQHQELSRSMHDDQEENSRLRRQIQITTDQSTQLRTEIQKLEKDSRFQKGMVAINKRQVNAAESETKRLQSQIAELSGQTPFLESKASSSPSLPIVNMTNPFHRIETASPSPPFPFAPSPNIFSGVEAQPNQTFDDIFGNSSDGFSADFLDLHHSPFETRDLSEVQNALGEDEVGRINSAEKDSDLTVSADSVMKPAQEQPYEPTLESRSNPSPIIPSASSEQHASADTLSATGTENTTTKCASEFGKISSNSQVESAQPIASSHSQTSSNRLSPMLSGSESTIYHDTTVTKNASGDPFTLDSQSLFSASLGMVASKFPELGPSNSNTLGVTSDAFSTEFPPLAEYEEPGGSDSEEAIGFQDNFQPAATFALDGREVAPADKDDRSLDISGVVPVQTPRTDVHQVASLDNQKVDGGRLEASVKDIAEVDSNPQGIKPAFDDFDDAFTDLADATQVDTDDIEESEYSDKFTFDPNFDQIPPRPAKIESKASDFDAIFAGFDKTAPDVSLDKDAPELKKPSMNDDPMVKELMGMGFPRVAAIGALEKHNYDLSRASNFLLDQENKPSV